MHPIFSSGLGVGLVLLLNRGLTLVLSVVLARSLGVADYGVYSYALAIVAVVGVFAEGGYPMLVERVAAASVANNQLSDLRHFLRQATQRITLGSVSLAAVTAASALLLWGETALGTVVAVATILLLLDSLSRLWTRALAGFQRIVLARSLELVLRPFVVLIAILVFIWIQPTSVSPHVAIAIQIGSASVVLGTTFLLLKSMRTPSSGLSVDNIKSQEWRAAARTLMFAAIATIINSQVDVLILGVFRPPEAVGIYRIATQGALLAAFGLVAANLALAPKIAAYWAADKLESLQQLISSSARMLLLVALPCGALVFLYAQELVVFVFGDDFAEAHLPLRILIVGHMVGIILGSLSALLSMTGHERAAADGIWRATALNILLNLVLTPIYGITGTACATAISLAALYVMLFRRIRQHTGIRPSALQPNLS